MTDEFFLSSHSISTFSTLSRWTKCLEHSTETKRSMRLPVLANHNKWSVHEKYKSRPSLERIKTCVGRIVDQGPAVAHGSLSSPYSKSKFSFFGCIWEGTNNFLARAEATKKKNSLVPIFNQPRNLEGQGWTQKAFQFLVSGSTPPSHVPPPGPDPKALLFPPSD